MPGLFLSWDCCNNLLQTWGLPRTEMSSLTVLEARSLKSRCGQGSVLSEGLRGESFLPLLASLGRGSPSAVSVFTWLIRSMSVSKFPLFV